MSPLLKPMQALQTLKAKTQAKVQHHQAQRRRAQEALDLRPASAADLPRVLILLTEAGMAANPHGNEAALWSRIEACGGQVWLAERGGLLLGSLTLFILPLLAHGGAPAALVDDMVVHPSARRMGIGRALMQQATDCARAAGACKLALAPQLKRGGAQNFYERLGYARHGRSVLLPPELAGTDPAVQAGAAG
jgi:GNAT superfamily N-acetyltransferase